MMHLKYNKRRPPRQNARRRLLHFEQCEERLLLSVSPSGEPASEVGLLAGDISEKTAIRVRIETTNAAGMPISDAGVGEEFLVNVYVQDVRETAVGVFATYLDLLYDSDIVLAGDVVQFGNGFPHGRVIDASIPGVIDEVGGFAGFKDSGAIEELLISMPFVATRPGQVDFVGEQPDYVGSIPLVYGHNFGVPFDEVDFGIATINVNAPELSRLASISTSPGSMSRDATSAFQPVDLFRTADERGGTTAKLSDDSRPHRHFATTRATDPFAGNGGFSDLGGIGFDDRADVSLSFTHDFDADVILAGQDSVTPAFEAWSQGRRILLSGEITTLPPVDSVRRVAEDHLRDGNGFTHLSRIDQLASSVEIRSFTPAELPGWNDTVSPIRSTTEFDAENVSETIQRENARPNQIATADLSDSTSTNRDDSVREMETQTVAFSTPTGNGGYINLADLRQVAPPRPVEVSNIREIQIARTDNRPASRGAARISKGASEVALASLTWQLHVDGLRGVSLAFEMAEESPEVQAAQRSEIRDTNPSPRNDSGRPASSPGDTADPDIPIMPPDAKSVSFSIGDGAHVVQDERRHYLALSPLVVMVAGALLVTDHWQKLQPREEKQKPRQSFRKD